MGHFEAMWSLKTLKVNKLLKFCMKKFLRTERKPSKIALIFPPANENLQNYRLAPSIVFKYSCINDRT